MPCASLVERAEQWPCSSVCPDGEKPPLDPGPAPRGAGWVETVNAPMTEAEGEAIRTSIRRNRPLGTDPWVRTTAEKLGLQSNLRALGVREHRQRRKRYNPDLPECDYNPEWHLIDDREHRRRRKRYNPDLPECDYNPEWHLIDDEWHLIDDYNPEWHLIDGHIPQV